MTSPVLKGRSTAVAVAPQESHDAQMTRAVAIAKAGDMLPRQYKANPGAILLAMDWADRHGVSTMDALHGVSWVQGRPVIDATLQRSLAIKAGYRIIPTEVSRETATVQVVLQSTGQVLGSATYTMDDARTAGLASKDNWKKNPEDMLLARASTRAVRRFAPDALIGGALAEDEGDYDLEGDPVTVLNADPEPTPQPEPEPAPVVPEPEEDITDAEVIELADVVDLPTTASNVDQDATPETRGKAKAAVERIKADGNYSTLVEQMKAEGIGVQAARWTEAQAARVVELADGIAQ